jgi:hypothetical protein
MIVPEAKPSRDGRAVVDRHDFGDPPPGPTRLKKISPGLATGADSLDYQNAVAYLDCPRQEIVNIGGRVYRVVQNRHYRASEHLRKCRAVKADGAVGARRAVIEDTQPSCSPVGTGQASLLTGRKPSWL